MAREEFADAVDDDGVFRGSATARPRPSEGKLVPAEYLS